MTADEIQQIPPDGRSVQGWLKEIAVQLARFNERQEPKPAVAIKRK